MVHFHHHASPDKKQPRFTLATRYNAEEAILEVGIAKCSSKEKNFNKKLGRVIAEARLVKKPIIVPVHPEQEISNVTKHFKAWLLNKVEQLNGSYTYDKIQKEFHHGLALV